MSEAVETASKTDQSNTKKGEENFSEEIKVSFTLWKMLKITNFGNEI